MSLQGHDGQCSQLIPSESQYHPGVSLFYLTSPFSNLNSILSVIQALDADGLKHIHSAVFEGDLSNVEDQVVGSG